MTQEQQHEALRLAGMYPQLPRATMFATVLDGGFAIGNIGVYTPDQMRAYADATCTAREPLRKRECLHKIQEPDHFRDATQMVQAARHASQRDELLQVALDFIGTLTGMSPPPIETAPPEVFGPFYAFVDRVQAITAPQVQADARDALEEAASVLSSINKGASHEVTVGDEVCYWQRKEWIDWAEKEVLPKVRAAIAAAKGE